MNALPALALEGVSKRYSNAVLALDNVSWLIETGARACLLGPNGAGKSTAIRLLQGAIRPTSGRVTLLGTDVGSPQSLQARRRTGIVPQGPGMYPDITTQQYLELAHRLYGRGNLARAMEVFGLGLYRETRMAQLSGGFQRRIVLAAALLAEPDLLLLDEPTVGLDPIAAHDVHVYLREAMAGRTTLFCTHNLTEAEALCDEVIILRGGRVLVHDSLEGLRRRAGPQVRLAARQGPAVLMRALRERGLEAAFDEDETGVLLPVRDPEAQAPDLLRALLGAGLDVYECYPVQATLETLFLDLVRSAP